VDERLFAYHQAETTPVHASVHQWKETPMIYGWRFRSRARTGWIRLLGLS